jgi:Dynamin central region
MSFVRGEKNPLKLGYYVLRNRGKLQESSSSEERDTAESEFFAQEPWSSLGRDHVGVHALKKRLQELLVDITRRELPNVRRQISARLDNCRKDLKAMGADRKSTVQQQIYLQAMATNFQKATDHALDAYYARNPIFAEIPEMRLPTLVVDRSDKFAADLAKKGHTVEFNIDDDESEEDIGNSGPDGDGDEIDFEDMDKSVRDSSDGEADVAPTPSIESNAGRHKYPELSSLFPDVGDAPEPQHRHILDWIEQEYRKARGSGLQVISPSVLPTLWQQQSNNWRAMTRKYLSDIIIYVHDFICKLMEHVCQEERTRSGLMAILLERFIDQYKVAIKHVDFLLEVELDGTPLTKNPSFQENLHKFRLERLGAAMSKSSIATDNLRDASGQEIKGTVVRLEDVMLSGPMGDIQHAVNDIYCILKAYYEIARRRYVDAICTQGTDYHLLNGKNSPLRIFSPLFVASLTPEQLEEIAGEDASSKERRESLKREMDSLEEGKRLLSH